MCLENEGFGDLGTWGAYLRHGKRKGREIWTRGETRRKKKARKKTREPIINRVN